MGAPQKRTDFTYKWPGSGGWVIVIAAQALMSSKRPQGPKSFVTIPKPHLLVLEFKVNFRDVTERTDRV
jgi:hypothetical protein